MRFHIHNVANLGPYERLVQFTNWYWRGFVIRIGNRQFDIFWRPQWSPGIED